MFVLINYSYFLKERGKIMALYKIDINGSIWTYNPDMSNWMQISDPGTRTLSLAGGLGAITLVRLDADRSIWGYVYDQFGTPPSVWNRIDNNPNTRAIAGSNGGFYQLHGDGSIWAYAPPWAYTPPWQELDNNPATRAIVAGPTPTHPEFTNGPLYKLHGDGSLWQFTVTSTNPPPETSRVIERYGWQQLDDTGDTIAVAQDYSALYQLRRDGSILTYTGTPITGWLQIYPPSNVRSIVAGTDPRGPSLYFLDGDGLVAQYTGTPGVSGWLGLGTDPATIAIAVDYDGGATQLYRLDGDGSIWVYVEGILPPPPEVTTDDPAHPPSSLPGLSGWQKIDSNPGTVSIWTVQPEALLV